MHATITATVGRDTISLSDDFDSVAKVILILSALSKSRAYRGEIDGETLGVSIY